MRRELLRRISETPDYSREQAGSDRVHDKTGGMTIVHQYFTK